MCAISIVLAATAALGLSTISTEARKRTETERGSLSSTGADDDAYGRVKLTAGEAFEDLGRRPQPRRRQPSARAISGSNTATAIAVTFIQGTPPQVTGAILTVGGVVVEATVTCVVK